jgi:hypothetical protein
MIKGITHAHLGPIWYHSEPSDVPYFPNQFLALGFFCPFLQQDCSQGLILYFFFNVIVIVLVWLTFFITLLYSQTIGDSDIKVNQTSTMTMMFQNLNMLLLNI